MKIVDIVHAYINYTERGNIRYENRQLRSYNIEKKTRFRRKKHLYVRTYV